MNETVGDLWTFHEKGEHIGIACNIGWNRAGHGIMGLGTAHQAVVRFPAIAQRWGQCCINGKKNTPVTIFPWNLVMIPTKPLNQEYPWLSWDQPSDFALLDRSLLQLAAITTPVFLPLLGAGAGRLPKADVLLLMRERLRDTPHTIVHKHAACRLNSR